MMLKSLILIATLVALAQSAPSVSKEETTTTTTTTKENGIPLDPKKFEVNPCETSRNFNYYVPFPNDTTSYIQCNPWGTGIIKKCDEGLFWDMWELKCDEKKDIHNMTLVLPLPVFNCSLSGFKCLNDGVCTESDLGGDRCVCKPGWTGQECESRVDTSDLTHEILNGTFDIHEFISKLEKMNLTIDVVEYTKYKDQLEKATYTQLMNYMNLYKGKQVRYDTVMNNLVEAILENIYPDAAYLASFNSSSVSIAELVQLIPNLMSYSKYSLERYQDVLARYQQILTSLMVNLNAPKHKHLVKEASEYAKLAAIFMNQTVALMNKTEEHQTLTNAESVNTLLDEKQQQHPVRLTESQVREKLRAEFNSTLTATQKLFSGLEKFQKDIIKMMKNNDLTTMTLATTKFEGADEIKKMLDQISTASIQIWDQLVNYGFWYITGSLCEHQKETIETIKTLLPIPDIDGTTTVAATVEETTVATTVTIEETTVASKVTVEETTVASKVTVEETTTVKSD